MYLEVKSRKKPAQKLHNANVMRTPKDVRTSQFWPVNPPEHVHEYPLPLEEHEPCTQGFGEHGLATILAVIYAMKGSLPFTELWC